MTDAKLRLSLDEIMDEISQVARSGEGPDKFRALKMLASMDSAGIVLPPPMNIGEVVERLSRVMLGAGPEMVQEAYQLAFPKRKGMTYLGAELTYADATEDMRRFADKVTSLKVLNRKFPEHKVNGVPKGFPSYGSTEKKVTWCRQQALKILVERARAGRQDSHTQLHATTAADQDDRRGTEAPPVDLQEPEV